MGQIVNTLIAGLNQQMIQARIDTFDAKPFLFGKYFPVKKVVGFSWKTLQNQLANMNVAADLHTDNGTVLRKRRPVFEVAQGDIPHISISREMTRSEIKEYQTALALAQNEDATKLVQYWGEDVDFCFNGVQSELEFIAWKLVSGAGKLSFTTLNNATYANEFSLDYQVDEENLQSASVDWSDTKNADIIGDLAKFIKDGKSRGMNPKFGFINMNELYHICSSEQIIKACASYVSNAAGVSQTPDLSSVNAMLAKQAWLNGIQLRVIDQTITREYTDGTNASANPFDDRRLVLSETEKLGSTQYDILQENNDLILRAQRSHTVVKKYGEVEPQKEVTIGEADALPVFDTAYRNLYIRTDAKPWE